MELAIEQADWAIQRRDLLAVRHAVFVDEQGVPAALEEDENDPIALHLLARAPDGAPVATARLLPDGHVGRMAVLPAWRHRGLGTELLRRLVEVARERGQSHLVLHAQCHAEAFYRRLGFVAEGEIFDEAGIDHRRMRLPLVNKDD